MTPDWRDLPWDCVGSGAWGGRISESELILRSRLTFPGLTVRFRAAGLSGEFLGISPLGGWAGLPWSTGGSAFLPALRGDLLTSKATGSGIRRWSSGVPLLDRMATSGTGSGSE